MYIIVNIRRTLQVFSGNYDDTIEVKHVFSKPFEARYVRLEPLTWEQKIALKMDLLGCAEGIFLISILIFP